MAKTWRDKAHRLIENLCWASYLQANTRKDGRRYKRHHPYTSPALADELVQCLGNDDEVGAKKLFLSYDGINATY